ncbi:MAG: hypothetical protein RJA70_4568 [Pseudomonadota bacterium]|jgi:3-hydroxybutyryl-CoA dehydrogenase
MKLSDLKHVLVVGAGQMGRGIAQVCAQSGYLVTLSDADWATATAGRDRIIHQLDALVGKGRLTGAAAAETAQRLTASTVADAAKSAQLVIEAVSEDLVVKRRLFETLDATTPRDAILASNTSSISITELAGFTSRPDHVVGMHFMNPVPVMKLVEVVTGLRTSDATAALVTDLAGHLGKTVVRSQDRPGFIVNRILIPMLNEACFALQDGVACIEDIDLAIQHGLNHPMGPLRLADLIGLDTVLAIALVLYRDFSDSKYRPAPVLRSLVAAGQLGHKSDCGFYVYNDGKVQGPNPAITRLRG